MSRGAGGAQALFVAQEVPARGFLVEGEGWAAPTPAGALRAGALREAATRKTLLPALMYFLARDA